MLFNLFLPFLPKILCNIFCNIYQYKAGNTDSYKTHKKFNQSSLFEKKKEQRILVYFLGTKNLDEFMFPLKEKEGYSEGYNACNLHNLFICQLIFQKAKDSIYLVYSRVLALRSFIIRNLIYRIQ